MVLPKAIASPLSTECPETQRRVLEAAYARKTQALLSRTAGDIMERLPSLDLVHSRGRQAPTTCAVAAVYAQPGLLWEGEQ